MQIEWVFMGAAAFAAVVLFLVIRRTVRMRAKTIFAQAEEPTPQDVQKAQTPRTLPEGVSSLPERTGTHCIEQAAERAVLLWIQAVNSRNPALLEGDRLTRLLMPPCRRNSRCRQERERLNSQRCIKVLFQR